MRGADDRSVLLWTKSVTLLFLVFFVGCSRGGKVERAIVRQIHLCQAISNCRISVSRATSFEGEKMYAFPYSISQKDREIALGIADPAFREFQPQLVFLKSGRIVFQESEPADVENPLKDEVVFDSSSNTGIVTFSPSSFFTVEEESGPDGRYYVLKQVQ